jgi:hypothetical protein
MYTSVESAAGSSLMSGASRWLDPMAWDALAQSAAAATMTTLEYRLIGASSAGSAGGLCAQPEVRQVRLRA